MRISPPLIAAYGASTEPQAASIPALKLSPEVSKALIAGGIFDHDADKTIWSLPGKTGTTLGAPVGSPATINLAGVVHLHPLKVSGPDDVLVPAFRSVIEQATPALEQPGLEPIADAVALVVAAPEIYKALAHPSSKTAKEKFFLYGTNIARALAITSRAAHLPFDDAMDNVITLFKSGEEVYVAGEEKSVASAQRVPKKQGIAQSQREKPTR